MTPGRFEQVLIGTIGVVVLLAVTTGTSNAVCETPPIADATVIAQAVSAYEAHMGNLPPNLEALTAVVTNMRGMSLGPFISQRGGRSASWWRRFAYAPAGPAFRVAVTFAGGHLTLIGEKGSYDIKVEEEWCGAP